jgi:DNA mismatch endonuclease (patch repair protein)
MHHDSVHISERMRCVKSKDTTLEKAFSKLLRSNGIQYQSHPKIYGHPDFRVKWTKILVFCDSSFWHGRNKNEISGKAFKTNRNFWVKKLKYNKERDERINDALKQRGWKVLRFWDDDILKHSSFVLSRINRYVKSSNKK